MPKRIYDRSASRQDFDMLDFHDIDHAEIVVDEAQKLWVNINDKCVLRIGKIINLQLDIRSPK